MTDAQDIFTVGEEYTSGNGRRWLCIDKSNEFAWLRNLIAKDTTAYVWKLNGESVSLYDSTSIEYDIKPAKTITLYGGYDGTFEYFDNAPATTPDKKDTHKLTLPMGEDGPVSGTFTNENGDVIKVERIDG